MSLSSLIVQRQLATMRQVEEALARQVIYGGDLVTNLLEVVLVDETRLVDALATSIGLPPAPAGELPRPSEAVRLLVPFEVAARAVAVPLEARADVLVVAVSEPLTAAVRDPLASSLGMRIEQRAAPAVRIWQALARAYGTPLDRRMQRLIGRLGGEEWAAVAGAATMKPAARRRSTLKTFPTERAGPTVMPGESGATDVEMASARRVDRSTEPTPRMTVPLRAGQRHRGPLLFEDALSEAEEASDRDGLLALVFDFARQFFEYTALFLVHGDIAEGRDGFGNGATRERVLGIGVPLDLPSLLSRAREAGVPTLGTPTGDGLDAGLLRDLHRPPNAEMVVVPIVVRTRAVALLTGDCGDGGIDRDALRQITELAAHISKAFERVIVRRKLEGFVAGGKGSSGRIPAAMVPSKSAVPPAATIPVNSAAPPLATIPVNSAAPLPATIAANSAAPPPATIAANSAAPPPATIAANSDAPPPATIPAKRVASHPTLRAQAIEFFRPSAPPTANVAALRQITGPPIPREDPESSATVTVAKPDSVPASDSPGQGDEQAETEFAGHPETALGLLMKRFPGPVLVPRAEAARSTAMPASECGPVLRLVARARKRALPYLLDAIAEGEPEKRGWAVHLLCEMPYLEALPAVVALLEVADPATRASAAQAVLAMKKAFGPSVVEAILAFGADASPEQRASALNAMGEAREPATVGELIRGLDDEDEEVQAVAHDALVRVARQEFGRDARSWLDWWDQNADRHRVEWLIDALVHPSAEIRREAGEELQAQSRQYFGFSSDLPQRDRERVQQRYRDWWITEGRSRHLRP